MHAPPVAETPPLVSHSAEGAAIYGCPLAMFEVVGKTMTFEPTLCSYSPARRLTILNACSAVRRRLQHRLQQRGCVLRQ